GVGDRGPIRPRPEHVDDLQHPEYQPRRRGEAPQQTRHDLPDRPSGEPGLLRRRTGRGPTPPTLPRHRHLIRSKTHPRSHTAAKQSPSVTESISRRFPRLQKGPRRPITRLAAGADPDPVTLATAPDSA